jgi:predicted RNA-binding Zn-ribbon protein involved in translation (DUF1610 family)
VNLPVNGREIMFGIESQPLATFNTAIVEGDGLDEGTHWMNITGHYSSTILAQSTWNAQEVTLKANTTYAYLIDGLNSTVTKAVSLKINLQPEQPISLVIRPDPTPRKIDTKNTLVISGVIYYNTGTPVDGANVNLVFKPGLPKAPASLLTINGGHFSWEISDIPKGEYDIEISVTKGSFLPVTYMPLIELTVTKTGTNVALIIILVLLGLVLVVALIAVGIYFYFKSQTGKFVECGECGAFIGETSKKCPNCGTEFEEEIAKCSNCEAWVPSTSINCPECGVAFKKKDKEDPVAGKGEETLPPPPESMKKKK